VNNLPYKGARPTSKVLEVEIDRIIVPDWARHIDREYLAESVQDRGVIKPIVVGKLRDGKRVDFILVDGYGRLELACSRGDKTILARVVDISSPEEALLLAIELEYTKKSWDLEYTLRVINELIKAGYTKKKIAELLKIPRSTLYRILKLNEVDEEIKQKVLSGEIPLRALDSEKTLRQYLSKQEEKEEKDIEERAKEVIESVVSGATVQTYDEFIEEVKKDLEVVDEELEDENDNIITTSGQPASAQEKRYITVDEAEKRIAEQTIEDLRDELANAIIEAIDRIMEQVIDPEERALIIAKVINYLTNKYLRK